MVKAGALEYTIEADTKDFVQGITATKKELRDAKRAMRETLTPAEKYGQKIEKLERLHKKGLLTSKQYRRAVDLEKRKLREASVVQDDFNGGLRRMALVAKGIAIGAVIGLTASVFRLGSSIRQTMKDIDTLAKAAEKLGTTTQELQSLRFAASQFSGMDAPAFDMALQRMTRRVSEAAAGTGEAKDAIKELGLSAIELNAAGPSMAFSMIADAMSDVVSEQDRLRLAFKLFDSEGAALATTLSKGADELERMRDEFGKLGGAIDDFEADRIERANDAMERATIAAGGLKTELAIGLGPVLGDIADDFARMMSGANGMAGGADSLRVTTRGMFAALKDFATEGVIAPDSALRGIFAEEFSEGILRGAGFDLKPIKTPEAPAKAAKKQGEAFAGAVGDGLEMFSSKLAGIVDKVGVAGVGVVDDAETVFRALGDFAKQQEKSEKKPMKVEFPAAAQRGSREEFDLIKRITTGQRNDEERRHKEQLEQQRRAADFAEDTNRLIEALDTVFGVKA